MQLGLVGLGKMGFDMPAPAPKAQEGRSRRGAWQQRGSRGRAEPLWNLPNAFGGYVTDQTGHSFENRTSTVVSLTCAVGDDLTRCP
jgi:hypothetical protein